MPLQLVTTDPIYTQVNCGSQTSGGTTPPPPVISDAILRPRIIFSNGLDTPGQIYRMGGVDFLSAAGITHSGGSQYEGGTNSIGGGGQFRGQFDWHQNGGRQGGGYVTTHKNTTTTDQIFSRGVTPYNGNFLSYNIDSIESRTQYQFGLFGGFNFFASPPPQKVYILGFGLQIQGTGFNPPAGPWFSSFLPTTVLTIDTDMTIGISCYTITTGVVSDEIFYTSGIKAPLNEWWGIETQVNQQTTLNSKTGFVLAQLYTETGPIDGVPAIREIGVETSNSPITAFAIGSDVSHSQQGMDGLGIDDFVAYNSTGSVKGWIGKIYVAPAIVNGNGSETNSTQTFDSRRSSTHNHLGSPLIATIGYQSQHGDTSAKWKNVQGLLNVRPYNEPICVLNPTDGNITGTQISFGHFSGTTNEWIAGSPKTIGDPVNPAQYLPSQDIFNPTPDPATFDVVAMENDVVRNTLHDEQKDYYTVTTDRSNVLLIEGIQPTFRTGARVLIGGVFEEVVFGDYTELFSASVQHGTIIPADLDHAGAAITTLERKLGKFLLKDVNGSYESPIIHFLSGFNYRNAPLGGSAHWISRAGYTTSPNSFLTLHPVTNVPFTQLGVGALQAFSVGLRGDFTTYDADITPLPADSNHRWIEFDCCEIGFDYVYHVDIPTLIEHPAFPPIAVLIIVVAINPTTRAITVKDESADWDGSLVTLVVDWGDSTTDSITNLGNKAHTYAAPGVYTIKETVTDNDGLIGIFTLPPVNAFIPAAATFTATNPSGNELDLTDTSTGHDETISGWHWDFGDGNTSTSQNPVHTYAAPGTYTVVLTLTTNFSPPGSISNSVPIVVPFVVAGCNPSADFMANTANVIGDNYHGDNPPLTNYANTAAFDVFYLGGTHRHAYEGFYDNINDGVSHSIDSIKKFNGHNTLNMKFGQPGATLYIGAGWFSCFSNDADPVETLISTTKAWIRVRLLADAGIMTDASQNNDTFTNAGLEILSISPRGGTGHLMVRNGHLIWDDNSGAHHVIGSESLAGVGATGFKDVLMLYDGDNQHSVRQAFWFADACSLAGKTPSLDITNDYGAGATPSTFRASTSDDISFFNCQFDPSTSGVLKNLWVADWEIMPFSVDGNPFGVNGI